MQRFINLSFFLIFVPSLLFGQTLKKSFKAHEGGVTDLIFVKEKEMIISAGMDKRFHIWNVNDGSKIKSLAGHTEALQVEVMGDNLYTSGDNKVIQWSLASFKPKKILNHGQNVTDLIVNPGNQSVMSAGRNGVIFWNNQGKKITSITTDLITNSSTYSNDYLTLLYNQGNILQGLNPVTKSIKTFLEHSADIASFALSEDNIVIGDSNKELQFYNHSQPVKSVQLSAVCKVLVFSDDGQYLFAGLSNGSVNILSTKSMSIINTLQIHTEEITKIVVRQDMLITGSKDSFIKIYDISFLNILAINNKKNIQAGPPPEIQLIQPKIINSIDTVKSTNSEYIIKGKVSSDHGIYLLLVDGTEVSVGPQGDFSHKITLHYWDNNIVVKALDNNKSSTEKAFVIHRPFQGEETEYTRRGSDYALLIATDEYDEISDLTNPVFDANTIAKELTENYGFNVQTLLNPTQRDIYTTLRAYSKKTFSEQDQLFIFIAGHGEYDQIFQEGYLVVSDSKKDDEVKTSYVSHSNLRTIINNIPCEHTLLMMDVCFGGTFDPIIARRGEESYQSVNKEEFIHRKLKYKTRLYITSGGKEYVPDGRAGSHSPFTRNFLESLRSYGGADRVLTINEVGSFIEKTIPEPRKGEFGDNEPGSDFLFISN